jgi:hypothetical protein
MGLIAVDTQGRVGAAHNTPNLCWAYMTPKMHQPKANMKAKSVLESQPIVEKLTVEKVWENANL